MSEKVISIHRALPDGVEPTSIEIHIDKDFPEVVEKHYQLVGIYAQGDAEELECALHKVLPSATYDRLLAEMFKRKLTHFRGAYQQPDPEPVNKDLLAVCKAALARLYEIDDEIASPSELYEKIEIAIKKAEGV
jgi:hypothetical protein